MDNLYTLAPSFGGGAAEQEYRIRLNPAHVIYRAHFPGNPVTPGACLVQMCRELTEHRTGAALTAKILHSVKFLAVIDPVKNPEVVFRFLDIVPVPDGFRVSVAVVCGDISFSRLSITFSGRNGTF